MASLIAWLDASAEEQRRVREIVQLFSQRETQDELGGRRIVVTLSDALFPGTSVLHSRARYLLFIPWFVKLASTKKDQVGWLDWLERRMIEAFRDDDSVDTEERLVGLIGRDAGHSVKQLPSTAYWTALEAWGVLAVPGRVEATLERTAHDQRPRRTGDDHDELADRRPTVWHPGVGAAPLGFPDETLDGGFRLKHHEATWLRERWLATTGSSLLAHLAHAAVPLTGAEAPWIEPGCLDAPAEVLAVLDDAERFSLAIGGARLLYQLMVAERYLDRGFTTAEVDTDAIRGELDDWVDEVDARASLFAGWDPDEFWAMVRSRNARINPLARQFFDLWFDRVRRNDLVGVADDNALRTEVRRREHILKQGQARLVNDKLLANWQPGAPRRVTYRWPQVVRLVSDVVEGLGADAGT